MEKMESGGTYCQQISTVGFEELFLLLSALYIKETSTATNQELNIVAEE